MKKPLYYLLLFLALNFTCKSLTDDFSTSSLESPEEPESKWLSQEEPLNLQSLLEQDYTYLGKGKQAFVFLSQDQEHVLKLFKPLAPFFRISFFGKSHKITYDQIPLAKTLFRHFYPEECQAAKESTFLSYFNSFTFLKEETQVEYLHLTSTKHLKHHLKIYDKIGVLHTLPLDSTSFLIQKKTDLLYPVLSQMIQNKEIEKAKELLSNFVQLYLRFIDKGIVDPSNFEGNVGCVNLVPVQIDVGRVFTKKDLDPALSEEEAKIPLSQLYNSTNHMKKWLRPRSLELYEYVENLEKNASTSRILPLN